MDMKAFLLKWIALPVTAALLLGCGGDKATKEDAPLSTRDVEIKTAPPPTKAEIEAWRAGILKFADELKRLDSIPGPYLNSAAKTPTPKDFDALITDGVIEDYVTVIRFMDAREKTIAAIPRADDPDAPSVLNWKNREAKRIIFHRYPSPGDRSPFIYSSPTQEPITLWNMCNRDCPKLIIEKYADSVAYVTYDLETGDIIPDSVVEYRLSDTCDELWYGSRAMGLCINGVKPEKAKTITKAAGLHIYEKVASPYWPTGFAPDRPTGFSPDIIYKAPSFRVVENSPPAFENLQHVKVWHLSQHRALGLKRANKPEAHYIAFDSSCITVSPALPAGALPWLVEEATGEKSAIRAKSGYYISQICIGQRQGKDAEEYFQSGETERGNLDYSASISAHDIVRNLVAFYWKDPEQNAYFVKRAITELQRYHPEFQTKIGYGIAPDCGRYGETRFGP